MQSRLMQLIVGMEKKNIMIIGDVVADVYLEGRISRISREAPVLILEHMAENVVPGGAANAIHNAATLGGQVFAVGIVGDDFPGRELDRILAGKTVNTAGLIADSTRPTITKTRVMAGGQATVRQQVVRIDRETKAPVSANTQQCLWDYVLEILPAMSVVVFSDYGSGTISPNLRTTVIELCNSRGIPCIVDSRYNILDYQGITVVKQNESEAAAALGWDSLDEQSLLEAGRFILDRLEAQAVLITRGPDGMTLFEKDGNITHIPVTNKSEVYDVTGAGDTVVAAMALALAAGATYRQAADLANHAAGIVVRKLGTATTTPLELEEAIGVQHEKR